MDAKKKKNRCIALILTNQENGIKKTYDNRFAIPLDFDFFKYPIYPYGFRENLIIRLELNSSKKVIFCTGDTLATYKLSNIFLEYDAIFDKPYAMAIDEMYVETSIPYTKVTSIHYQALSKKGTTWKIDVNNLSVRSLQGLLLLFPNKHDDFANKYKDFYHPSIKKILVTINGMPHQLFTAGLQAREILPELNKNFYKEHSNVTCEEFLTRKFALWIDSRSSIDNKLHGSSRAVEKSGILLQIEKAPEVSGDLMCYVFSLEVVVAHLSLNGK